MTEILDRPKSPIIGRLLQEGGVWLVAPEDKRYASSYLVRFDVRTEDDEKLERVYVNLFPDSLAPPVY